MGRQLFTVDANTLGKGECLFSWQASGTLLAAVGVNRKVLVVDRQGKTMHSFSLPNPGNPIAIEWDCTGGILAVLQDKAQSVSLYNIAMSKLESLDTSLKDLSFMKWSKVGPQLALGNTKGGLVVYNSETLKKIPILGTHSKRIIAGEWNSRNSLAMIGEDKVLSISDAEGSLLDQVTLKVPPTSLTFTDLKPDDRVSNLENVAAVCLGAKTLLLQNIHKRDAPVELSFQHKYGSIAAVRFMGDGYCIVGFTTGHVVIMSLHQSELGNEVCCIKAHRDSLSQIAYSKNLRKCATIGDAVIRIFDLEENSFNETKSETINLESEFGALAAVDWTDDGQILTVSSKNGGIYCFLTKIPVLSAASGSTVLYLSSLREMCVRDVDSNTDVARIPIEIEPNFVASGNNIAAIGMNNQVYFYGYERAAPAPGLERKKSRSSQQVAGDRDVSIAKLIAQKTYTNIVDDIRVSANHAALLQGGRLILHAIDERRVKMSPMVFPDTNMSAKLTAEGEEPTSLPSSPVNSRITAFGLTDAVLYFATDAGKICIFSLMDCQMVVEYPHTCGVKALFPNHYGTRVAYIDQNNAAFVLNPTIEVATVIEGFNPATRKLMWDAAEYGVLVGHDHKRFTTYVYTPNSRHGSTCEAIHVQGDAEKSYSTSLPFGFQPVALFKGTVTCQMPNGTLAAVPLVTHKGVYTTVKADPDVFYNNMCLNRLAYAIVTMTSTDDAQQLGKKALHLLDIEIAIRVYRTLNQPTLVMCLEKIRHIQEKNVLIGHVSMILGQFNDAQNFFLRSSRPVLALEMRRDLMQWDHALFLAKTMAPEQVPQLSKDFAQQLEFRGEYAKSLEMFQAGHMEIPKGHASTELAAAQSAAQEHNDSCQAGAARCMLRTGSIRQGMQLCLSLKKTSVSLDCARILEAMKQFEEAGQLYESAEQYEKAVAIYIIETKNLKAASRLISKIKSRNILVLFAKAKESTEGNFQEAEQAYAQAEDWDNVVRIKVEYLNDLHGAYVIVRRTRSSDAAALVARMCQKKGENGAAVEFLVLAKKMTEAFELAQATNTMTNFEGALLSQVTLKDGVAPTQYRDDFLLVAKHYDKLGKHDLAGQLYHVGGSFQLALSKYLQIGTPEYIDKAVSVVGKSRSEQLTHKLLEFLMGELDGEPKDASYIFKLYMALGNYEKAAKTSVVIAMKEQESGNYRGAHKTLVDTCILLQENKLRIPSDLRRTLMLLHSYLIVKHLVKPLEDHDNASRMLLRVARNIAKFPQHISAILTSTVLECLKAEFKGSAFEYSCMLVQNEKLHAEISEKHKKKIEGLVRKRGKEEMSDPVELPAPCPFCQAPVPSTELDCGACRNTLPYCIVTGKHMVLDDWAQCPGCKFPAMHSMFVKLLRDTPNCPMCDAFVDPVKLQKVAQPDPKAFV